MISCRLCFHSLYCKLHVQNLISFFRFTTCAIQAYIVYSRESILIQKFEFAPQTYKVRGIPMLFFML